MNFRVRSPSGQATIGVDGDMTVAAFQEKLAERTGVPAAAQEVLAGFPPKLLLLPVDREAATVTSLGLQAGDSLTVRQITGSPAATSAAQRDASPAAAAVSAARASGLSIAGMSEDEQLARAIAASLGQSTDLPPAAPAATAAAPHQAAPPQPSRPSVATLGGLSSPAPPKGAPAFEPLSDGSAVVRRVVADDNSCLFSAVGYVQLHARSAASRLRSAVAEAVAADPFEWNEVVLGKAPAQYGMWILQPKSWGGAIELSILSKQFGREIAAFDIQTQRVDLYGQGAGYKERMMLVYDGLHYDALAVAGRVGASEGSDVTVLPSSGPRTDEVMAGAARLVAKAHAARQFTDTANFTLRCGICKVGLRGEREAVQHAQTTGHQNFTEY